jgi:hypothetical protein
VGFALPAGLLRPRCALTAPFHPYPYGRYIFCGTFRKARFERTLPAVSRHAALWRPDFPPRKGAVAHPASYGFIIAGWRSLKKWGNPIRLYGVVFFCVLLAGCSGNATQRALMLETAGKPREALALDGVSRLREAFNRGACRSIFDEADRVFRLSRPRQAWLNECERMRKRLGLWLIFRTDVEHSPGIPLSVVVRGEAEFVVSQWRTRANVVTVWHFDRGRAELFSLFWDAGPARPMGSWPSDPRNRHLDPPPKRNAEPA